MRRRPTARAGRGTGYEPAYADSGALRTIAAGLSAEAAAAVAAVAPDLVGPVGGAVPPARVASYPLAGSGPVRGRVVRLGFADASTVDLGPADPWRKALLAVARDLLATKAS